MVHKHWLVGAEMSLTTLFIKIEVVQPMVGYELNRRGFDAIHNRGAGNFSLNQHSHNLSGTHSTSWPPGAHLQEIKKDAE
jgi:hypothetical protein